MSGNRAADYLGADGHRVVILTPSTEAERSASYLLGGKNGSFKSKRSDFRSGSNWNTVNTVFNVFF